MINVLLKRILNTIIFFMLPIITYTQKDESPSIKIFKDTIYNKSIKTVQIYKNGNSQNQPIIRLNYGEEIVLSFDEISDEIKDYYYDFIHCDAKWRATDLSQNEYLEGFFDNQITDYKYSFNTFHHYIHYTIVFPNNDVNLKLSGNYVINIYKDYNKDSIMLTRRFFIVDQTITFDAQIKKPIMSEYFEKGQQIYFKINHGNYRIFDPHNDIKILIRQNGRWDNAITNIKPLFISNNELDYRYHDKNIFMGGSEYRYFSIKSMRYQSEFIKNIEYRLPYYYVELFDDKPRTFNRYFFNDDINGKYMIDVQEGTNSETDADYVYVSFSLPYDAPFVDGNLYIFGALTNWEFSDYNNMQYNFEKKAYEKTLLLKQGYYNYQYAFVLKGSKIADIELIEGSHHQTENDYEIFVYHQKPGSRYTELIGYKKLNSLKNQ